MSIIAQFDNGDILHKIFANIRNPIEESHHAVVREMIDLYRDSIALVRRPAGVSPNSTMSPIGAIRTGYFRQTVRERSLREAGDSWVSEIASDAPYSDIVERGRRDVNYPGRFPAQMATDAAWTVIGPAFDVSFNNYFGSF